MSKKHRHAKFPRRKRRLDTLKYQPTAGASPGALVPHPDQTPTEMSVLQYDAQGMTVSPVSTAEEVKNYRARGGVTWLRVTGLANLPLLEGNAAQFGLHRLVLEDVLNLGHRPKVEDYDSYLFIIVKIGAFVEQFEAEQMSMVILPGLVITFHEKPSRLFDPVVDRITKATGRFRQYGADYLAYAILDTIVDGYYPILETLNQRLEVIENEMLSLSGKTLIQKIYNVKSDLLYLHRAVWPMKDIINLLSHEDCPVITASIHPYLRDCQDQCMQITELSEFYRDIASGLMNTFLAYSGHKMNEIMKMLTMISAIFIPLSFIAGVYGMNFHHMPELGWEYGYPLALGIMLSIAVGMLVMFRRRGWLGRTDLHDEKKP